MVLVVDSDVLDIYVAELFDVNELMVVDLSNHATRGFCFSGGDDIGTWGFATAFCGMTGLAPNYSQIFELSGCPWTPLPFGEEEASASWNSVFWTIS